MPENLKNLLDQINAKKAEVQKLADENKLDEAKAAKDALIALQAKFDLLYDLDDENKDYLGQGAKPHKSDQKPGLAKLTVAFVGALKSALTKKPLSDEHRDVLESYGLMDSSAPDEDGNSSGGVTIPPDIQTGIIELRRTHDDLEQYVNVEKVGTNRGSRVIESLSEIIEWEEVDEGDEFPEEETPKFKTIRYRIKKFGGILKVTYELLQDTAENIVAYLKKYIAKKSRVTRNGKILRLIKAKIESGAVATEEISDLDGLKDIFNQTLPTAITSTSIVITNKKGFAWLDKLKDEDGKYVLQPDPTKRTQKLLFGDYPVIRLENQTLKRISSGRLFLCGDFAEAITLFDREHMTIEVSNVAGDLWKTDKTGFKIRDRFDVQGVDLDAIVVAYLDDLDGITMKPDDDDDDDDEVVG